MADSDTTQTDYNTDILEWSEHQATLLRRLGAGEHVNDQIDWENVAEEIESVGKAELRACRSFLVQAVAHHLKIMAWPQSAAVPGWRDEIRRFRADAIDASTPSIERKLEIAQIYRRALLELPREIDGQPPGPLPPECPWTLDELLAEPTGQGA